MSYERIQIDNSAYMHSDLLIVDRYGANELVFASIIANDTLLKNIGKTLKKKVNGHIESRCHVTISGCKYSKEKKGNTDFAHMLIYKNDIIDKSVENETYQLYIIYRTEQELNDLLYDKLYQHTPIPMLKEWMPYLLQRFRFNRCVRDLSVYQNSTTVRYNAIKINIIKMQLLEIIQVGLRTGTININNAVRNSTVMNEIQGIDSYLNIYGDLLANKIQQSFVPKFTPNDNQYTEYVHNFDDSCYYGGIEIYEAQKAVIQSAKNNLDKNKTTFIIGEMGTGKTLIGCGIVYAHYGKKVGSTTIILCPGHLCDKWKREVERLVPNAKAYIVENISQLMDLENKIKDKNKKEAMYVIMSKENAKFSYEVRPAAVWSHSKHCFVCPECGKKLYKEVWKGEGRHKYKDKVYLVHDDFLKENSENKICINEIKVLNKATNKWETKTCNAKLWTPLNKFEKGSKWAKLGTDGWIMKGHVNDLYRKLYPIRNELKKKEKDLLNKIIDAKNELEVAGDVTSSRRGVRKYSLARYIRERLNGYIDYCILDELHEYKGKSLQGDAMGDIAMASNKVIGLTGTLLNGYAKGVFYILYRTMPMLMKQEDFEYSDERAFQRQYGVIKNKSTHERNRNGGRGTKVKKGSDKDMPGVSPLVFTKYLLENAAFVSISDMAEGLPNYEEIPIGVDMDDRLADAYSRLESDLRSACSWGGGGGMKTLGALLQSLQTYPDMPYNQLPMVHPDTLEILATPMDLGEGLRNKETALLDLVREKKAAGEKVLVYYQYTNRTDTADKLVKMFTDNGIKTIHLTSKVKLKNREKWINDNVADCDVMICNPKLVETGLDLLDFINIVFYQIGYNLFTMRQASRRSWRLSQTKDVKVYFMYYRGTIQETALALMASKLKASLTLEGKFSEEGLRAMADNEDLNAKIAASVVAGIKNTVEADVFKTSCNATSSAILRERVDRERKALSMLLLNIFNREYISYLDVNNLKTKEIKEEKIDIDTKNIMTKIFNKKISLSKLA